MVMYDWYVLSSVEKCSPKSAQLHFIPHGLQHDRVDVEIDAVMGTDGNVRAHARAREINACCDALPGVVVVFVFFAGGGGGERAQGGFCGGRGRRCRC